MNYAQLLKFDTSNWWGISVTLYVSGCCHNCPGCHNKEAQDPEFGKPFTGETLDKVIDYLHKDYVNNFVISGGDPFYPSNRKHVFNIIEEVIKSGYTGNIVIYTGYKIDDVDGFIQKAYRDNKVISDWLSNKKKNTMFIVDGKYEADKKPRRLQYRGSTNQRASIITPELESKYCEGDIFNSNDGSYYTFEYGEYC